jgi:hypothetical protein
MLYDGLELTEGTSITNAAVAKGTAFPSNPSEGELFYRTDLDLLHVYDGAAWAEVGSGGAGDVSAAGNNTFTGDNTFQGVTAFEDVVTGIAPTADGHLATKSYVDSVAAGLDPKASVRVATTANITLSGTQTIDGISVVAGDRVLVKDQTAGSQNGIYVVASGSWTRAADFDGSPAAEVTSGAFCFVTSGTTNGVKGFVLTTNNPITLGTTALTFSQFSSGGISVAGTNTGDIQYKSGSALAASVNFNFNGSNTLTIGAANSTGYIYSGESTGSSPGGTLSLRGGTNSSTGQGGNIVVMGGYAQNNVPGTVIISGGERGTGGNGGHIQFNTYAPTWTERFRILVDGSWSLGSSGTAVGTAGQVLTSNGAGAVPTWQTVTASAATSLAGTGAVSGPVGGQATPGVWVGTSASQPYIAFYNSGAPTTKRYWDFYQDTSAGTLHFRTGSDSVSGLTDWLTATRTDASTVGALTLTATNILLTAPSSSGKVSFVMNGTTTGQMFNDGRFQIRTNSTSDDGFGFRYEGPTTVKSIGSNRNAIAYFGETGSGLAKSFTYSTGTATSATTNNTSDSVGHFLSFAANTSDQTWSSYNPVIFQAHTLTSSGGAWGYREIMRLDPGNAIVAQAYPNSTAVLIGRTVHRGNGTLQVTGGAEFVGPVYVAASAIAANYTSSGLGALQVIGDTDLANSAATAARIRSQAANTATLYLQNSVSGTATTDGSYLRLESSGVDLTMMNSETGYLRFGTSGSERFRILSDGGWSVGTNGTSVGTSGQVLTSNGSGAAPTWQSISATFNGGTVSGATTFSAAVTAQAGIELTSTTAVAVNGTGGSLRVGYLNNAITSVQDAFVTWTNGTHALATGGNHSANGTLVLAARNVTNAGISLATLNSVRMSIRSDGRIQMQAGWSDTKNAPSFSATPTIDCAVGNSYAVTLTTDITSVAFSNVPAAGNVFTLTMFLTQDSTGARTITWPASVKWSGGAAAVLTTTPTKTDIIQLVTHDGGTTWYATVVGMNF